MAVASTDQTLFLTLNTRPAWETGRAIDLRIDDGGVTIAPTVTYALEQMAARAELGRDLEVADFAVGQCNLLYILDQNARTIWIYDPGQERFESIAGAPDLFTLPTGIAYVPGSLYISDIDSKADRRLTALAELNWQIRWTVGATTDATGRPLDLVYPFSPVDLAADAAGSIYALTPLDMTPAPGPLPEGGGYVPKDGRLAIVKLDRTGRVLHVFTPEQLRVSGRTELTQLSDQVGIAVAGDGSLYVLEAAGKRVLKFSSAGVHITTFPIDQKQSAAAALSTFAIRPSSLGIDNLGQLYIGDGRKRAELGKGEEDARFIRLFSAQGEYLREVSGYRGTVTKLAVDRADRIYLYNDEERALIILRPEETYAKEGGLSIGYYFSRALDSTKQGTRWHRLLLDADIPTNTQVQVSSLVADTPPRIRVDDQEQPLDTFLDNASPDQLALLHTLDWSTPLINPTDALIGGPGGRYLWLRLALIGNEQAAPTLRSIRAYFPRRSYLRYLPAVYQEDERSRDVLERFLSLFETFFAGMERQIDQVVRTFDADVVGRDFLRWLASWLAIAAEAGWGEDRLRTLLKRAPQLYRQRGTRAGIADLVEIFTGDPPLIVERHQLRCSEIGDDDPADRDYLAGLLRRLYGDDPYRFCVLLKPQPSRSAEELAMIWRLLDTERPAYTNGRLLALQPWIYLDMHTYLEINTYLSMPTPRLDAGAAMPRDTLLGDVDEAGQVARRARLDIDTTLS